MNNKKTFPHTFFMKKLILLVGFILVLSISCLVGCAADKPVAKSTNAQENVNIENSEDEDGNCDDGSCKISPHKHRRNKRKTPCGSDDGCTENGALFELLKLKDGQFGVNIWFNVNLEPDAQPQPLPDDGSENPAS